MSTDVKSLVIGLDLLDGLYLPTMSTDVKSLVISRNLLDGLYLPTMTTDLKSLVISLNLLDGLYLPTMSTDVKCRGRKPVSRQEEVGVRESQRFLLRHFAQSRSKAHACFKTLAVVMELRGWGGE